ncbi:MAG TPA: 4,5-DOPA dioxygenase extradiol [Bacteroidales bacterium]|nr:4,5-DOPA dioxygenase extradiol [Bacteroidales bacterium]
MREGLNNLASNLRHSEKMPVLFLGHGSPMNAIEENEFVRGWRTIGQTLPRPSAILCISAHWETRGTHVTAMEKPETIHDFGGFPKKLFEVEYPAPGSPRLAGDTKELVKDTNVGLDESWGLDHGCWSVVSRLYPEADIPVIQMSLDYLKDPQFHFDLAAQLAPLRRKGVLIIGSGNMVHNLALVNWYKINEPGYGYDWAIEASEIMKEHILSGDFRQLIDFRKQGKAFDLAVPTPDHYLPLLYSLALKEKNENVTIFNDKAIMGSLTMTSLKIH